jgi:hypothetical protein
MDTLKTGTDVSNLSDHNAMLEASNLNWDIIVNPMRYGDFGEYEAPGIYGAYRSDNNEFIDVYRSRKAVSNLDALVLFDAMLKAFDTVYKIDSLGEVRDGKHIYMSSKLPITISPEKHKGDVTEVSIIMTKSHLNGVGGSISLYYERLACTNGMTTPVKTGISITHSNKFAENCLNSFNGIIELIRKKQDIINVLSVSKLNEHEAEDIVTSIFNKKSEDSSENTITTDNILNMFEDNSYAGSEMVEPGTCYALLNCATEYFSHYQTVANDKHRFANIIGVQPSQAWLKSMMKLEQSLIQHVTVSI